MSWLNLVCDSRHCEIHAVWATLSYQPEHVGQEIMTGQKLRVAILALTTILAVRWMNINRLEAYQTAPQQARPTDALIYSVKGPDLFRAYCASCHGINGAETDPRRRH